MKEAIEFALFFKKERISNSCTLSEVARMVRITRSDLQAFELLHLEETVLLKHHQTLSQWMSQTPNFQAVKDRKEEIVSQLTQEEIKFVDVLVKTRKRHGKNLTQLANVFGTSAGTVSAFVTFNMSVKNWREWKLRLEQWVQDQREYHDDIELDDELPDWSIFLDSEQLESVCQKVAVLENYWKNNLPLRIPYDQKILQIAKEINLDVKKVKLWFLYKFQV